MNKTLYMLCGFPGSGKSFLSDFIIEQYYHANADLGYVSSDQFIEKYADMCGKTYSEVFTDLVPAATAYTLRKAHQFMQYGADVLWDQCNLDPSKRKKIVNMAAKYGYKVHCIYVNAPFDVCLSRIKHREGKEIPMEAMEHMWKTFVPPSIDEGFRLTVHDGYSMLSLWELND